MKQAAGAVCNFSCYPVNHVGNESFWKWEYGVIDSKRVTVSHLGNRRKNCVSDFKIRVQNHNNSSVSEPVT